MTDDLINSVLILHYRGSNSKCNPRKCVSLMKTQYTKDGISLQHVMGIVVLKPSKLVRVTLCCSFFKWYFFFFCLIRNVNLLSIVWPQEILLILKENSSIFWQLNDTSCFKIRNCISVHKNSWKKSLKFKVYFAMEMKLKKANVGNKLLKAIKNHYS